MKSFRNVEISQKVYVSIVLTTTTLHPISRFMLNKKFQRNAKKITTFYIPFYRSIEISVVLNAFQPKPRMMGSTQAQHSMPSQG